MKGGKCTTTLAKIWVEGITRIRDIRGNVLPKFIELCTETPCWSSSGWAPAWRTETNRNICYRVLPQKREFTLEELINIKVILFLTLALNCLDSKISRKSHFFIHMSLDNCSFSLSKISKVIFSAKVVFFYVSKQHVNTDFFLFNNPWAFFKNTIIPLCCPSKLLHKHSCF